MLLILVLIILSSVPISLVFLCINEHKYMTTPEIVSKLLVIIILGAGILTALTQVVLDKSQTYKTGKIQQMELVSPEPTNLYVENIGEVTPVIFFKNSRGDIIPVLLDNIPDKYVRDGKVVNKKYFDIYVPTDKSYKAKMLCYAFICLEIKPM